MPILDNYISLVEATEILGVHWETVKRMCREGRIPAKKTHNMWLIDRNEVVKLASTYKELRRGSRRNKSVFGKYKGTRDFFKEYNHCEPE